MSMHLLPCYWTTTNHKKRKKKKLLTPRIEKELEAYEKFLSKMGVDSSYTRTATPLKTERLSKQLPDRNIKDYYWKVYTPKASEKLYKGNAVIGQAYNKGNLVVLSSKEASDGQTGKRR